jgi:hypothetical protein
MKQRFEGFMNVLLLKKKKLVQDRIRANRLLHMVVELLSDEMVTDSFLSP